MTKAAARHGYSGATVARVCEHAGISRATFYTHFANKDECFLAAYREHATVVAASVHRAASGSVASERPRAVLEALLGALAADPHAAKLVLVEALAAKRSIRAEHELLIAALESSIEGYLEAGGELQLAIPAGALLGGVAGTITAKVLAGEACALPAMLDGLLAWVESYSLPPGSQRWTEDHWRALGRALPSPPGRRPEPVRPLPRGRGAMNGEQAARLRRERIIAAAAQLCAERGYESLKVADIVARARVTRGAFYSSFRSREDVFRAAQTVALQESIGAAASEFFLGRSWPERIWRAGQATLSYLGSELDLAQLGIVETYAAGEAALRRQHDTRTAYTVFLEEGYREAPYEVPRIASEAIGWGVFALIRREVLAGSDSELFSLLPQGVYVTIAPFIGPSAAMEFVEAQCQSVA